MPGDAWHEVEDDGFFDWVIHPGDEHISYSCLLGVRLRAVVNATEIRIERYGSGEFLVGEARGDKDATASYDVANALRLRAGLARRVGR